MKGYSVVVDAAAPPAVQRLGVDLNSVLARIAAEAAPRVILKARLPSNGSERLAIVPDEVGGPALAFFDATGGVWRRSTDNVVVS